VTTYQPTVPGCTDERSAGARARDPADERPGRLRAVHVIAVVVVESCVLEATGVD
jgi:hypothetical protein